MAFDIGKFLNNFNKTSENVAKAKNALKNKDNSGEKSVNNNEKNDLLSIKSENDFSVIYKVSENVKKYAIPTPTPSNVLKYAVPDPTPTPVPKYAVPEPTPEPTPTPVPKYAVPEPTPEPTIPTEPTPEPTVPKYAVPVEPTPEPTPEPTKPENIKKYAIPSNNNKITNKGTKISENNPFNTKLTDRIKNIVRKGHK